MLPTPPLLVPQLATGHDPELDDLRTACRDAVATVTALPHELLVVVGADGGPRATSFAPWGAPVDVDVPEALPLALLVGAGLTPGVLRSFVAVAPDLEPGECRALGAELAAAADRVALLVMGDGSARHSLRAPGYLDERAAPGTPACTRRSARSTSTALRGLDPALADELLVPRARALAGARRCGGRAAAGAGRGRVHRAVRRGLSRRDLDMTRSARVVAIVGPTATGKSGLAVALAHALRRPVARRGRQRRLDAALPRHGHRHGQAVRGRAARRAPPPARHLAGDRRPHPSPTTSPAPARSSTGCWPPVPCPSWSAAAGSTCAAALDRTGVPRAPTRRCAPSSRPSSPRAGAAALHARLAAIDPAAAAAILPSNGRRIVRALEVVALTGRPFTAALPAYESVYDVVQVGARPSRRRARPPRRRADGADVLAPGWSQEVRGAGARGAARGADGQPRARLPAGARACSTRAADEERGAAGRRRGRPGGSSAGSGRGSAATRGCAGCAARRGEPLARPPRLARRSTAGPSGPFRSDRANRTLDCAQEAHPSPGGAMPSLDLDLVPALEPRRRRRRAGAALPARGRPRQRRGGRDGGAAALAAPGAWAALAGATSSPSRTAPGCCRRSAGGCWSGARRSSETWRPLPPHRRRRAPAAVGQRRRVAAAAAGVRRPGRGAGGRSRPAPRRARARGDGGGARDRQPSRAGELSSALRDAGVALAVDDFGTWYSSLGHAGRAADRRGQARPDSFVRGRRLRPRGRQHRRRRSSELAHAHGVRVVAEGVESWSEGARLCELGCDRALGYLFSGPQRADAAPGSMLAHGTGWQDAARDGAGARAPARRPTQPPDGSRSSGGRPRDAYPWSVVRVREGARHGERLRRAARPGEARLVLTPGLVRALCDRGRGVGADGVLRVVGMRADGDRRPTGSWTTATPTGRSPRCAATASGCSPAISSPRALAPAGTVAVATRAGVRTVRRPGRRRRHRRHGRPPIALRTRRSASAARGTTRRARGRWATRTSSSVDDVGPCRSTSRRRRRRRAGRPSRTASTSRSSTVEDARHVRHAGARARRGGDPLVRHRCLRRRAFAAMAASGRADGD